MQALRPYIILVPLFLAACSADQLGIPRIAVRSDSPGGLFTASVRNHLSFDPPNQSLWLEQRGSPRVRLSRLGEDTDWCNAIAWSPDAERVAFLVQDARALVFDSASGRLVESVDLVERDHVPTSRAVRDLSFDEDGGSLTYTACDRRRGTDCRTSTLRLTPEPDRERHEASSP